MLMIDVMLCLALNVYHEARGEDLEGQFAVAQVTMNRAGGDPDKVCEVVFAPYQFSWTNDLVLATPQERIARADRFMPRESQAWDLAKFVAKTALNGGMADVVGDATHYHATRVSPRWAGSFEQVATIGRHVFYR